MRIDKLLLLHFAIFISVAGFSQEKKPALISGIVKDATTKMPLTEAVVTLSSNSFEGQKFALTDSTGKYRINNLPAGNYSIVFEMEGYAKFVQDNIGLKEGMSLGISFQMVKERKGKNKDEHAVRDTSNRFIKIDSTNSL